MIKEITNDDLTEEIIKIFSSYKKDSADPFNKLIGYYQEKLVGFISYSLIYNRCEINYIGVLEDYRNRKVASQLMDELLKKLHGCENITLEVNVENFAAISLYEKYGFRVVSVRKKYYGDKDAYLMIKELGG